MIDPSFDRVVPVSDMSVYALQDARIKELETQLNERYPTVEALQQKVAELENKLSLRTQQWEVADKQVRKYAAQVASFEEVLKENSWDFDGETLSDLASYFNLTLEREYSVEITIRFSGTVTAPPGYDMDNLENALYGDIGTYAHSVVESDFTEEGMEIFYEEI